TALGTPVAPRAIAPYTLVYGADRLAPAAESGGAGHGTEHRRPAGRRGGPPPVDHPGDAARHAWSRAQLGPALASDPSIRVLLVAAPRLHLLQLAADRGARDASGALELGQGSAGLDRALLGARGARAGSPGAGRGGARAAGHRRRDTRQCVAHGVWSGRDAVVPAPLDAWLGVAG